MLQSNTDSLEKEDVNVAGPSQGQYRSESLGRGGHGRNIGPNETSQGCRTEPKGSPRSNSRDRSSTLGGLPGHMP